MSPYRNIIAHKDFLKSLSKTKKVGKRRLLVALASPKQIKALQEVTHNVVKKNVPLTPCQVKALIKGKYKKSLLQAGAKTGSIESKRKIFLQRGGFLQFILPAALSYLATRL